MFTGESKVLNLEDLSLENLRLVLSEINRDIEKRNPITILNSWKTCDPKRLVTYRIIKNNSPRGIIGTLFVYGDKNIGDENFVSTVFTRYKKDKKGAIQEVKRNLSIRALEDYSPLKNVQGGITKYPLSEKELRMISSEVSKKIAILDPVIILNNWKTCCPNRQITFEYTPHMHSSPKGVFGVLFVYENKNTKEVSVFTDFAAIKNSKNNAVEEVKRSVFSKALEECSFLKHIPSGTVKEEISEDVKGYLEDDIISHIRKLLNKCEEEHRHEKKGPIAIEIFKYLAQPEAILYMKDHDRFRDTVLNKLEELNFDFANKDKITYLYPQFQSLRQKIVNEVS